MMIFLIILPIVSVILKLAGYVWGVAFVLKILNVSPLNEYTYGQFGIWWLELAATGLIIYFLSYLFLKKPANISKK